MRAYLGRTRLGPGPGLGLPAAGVDCPSHRSQPAAGAAAAAAAAAVAPVTSRHSENALADRETARAQTHLVPATAATAAAATAAATAAAGSARVPRASLRTRSLHRQSTSKATPCVQDASSRLECHRWHRPIVSSKGGMRRKVRTVTQLPGRLSAAGGCCFIFVKRAASASWVCFAKRAASACNVASYAALCPDCCCCGGGGGGCRQPNHHSERTLP